MKKTARVDGSYAHRNGSGYRAARLSGWRDSVERGGARDPRASAAPPGASDGRIGARRPHLPDLHIVPRRQQVGEAFEVDLHVRQLHLVRVRAVRADVRKDLGERAHHHAGAGPRRLVGERVGLAGAGLAVAHDAAGEAGEHRLDDPRRRRLVHRLLLPVRRNHAVKDELARQLAARRVLVRRERPDHVAREVNLERHVVRPALVVPQLRPDPHHHVDALILGLALFAAFLLIAHCSPPLKTDGVLSGLIRC